MDAYEWVFDLCGTLWDTEDELVADAMYDISTMAYNRDLDGVETVFPVLVAFARNKAQPWVELYARHMRQQGYVHSGTGLDSLLADIVATLAMTTHEDLRDCPQSVCAIQDLSLCYGAIDGPSYAEARIAALDDVLPRLDPHVQCASCLRSERMDALVSLGRSEEALEYGIDWVARAEAAGVSWKEEIEQNDTKLRSFVDAAIGAGRFDKAAEWIAMMDASSEQSRLWIRVATARLHIARGEFAAAASALPAFAELKAQPNLQPVWLAEIVQLTKVGVWPNDVALAETAEAVATVCERNGQVRNGFNSRTDAAALAFARGDRGEGLRHLHEAERLRLKLRKSFDADARLESLRLL